MFFKKYYFIQYKCNPKYARTFNGSCIVTSNNPPNAMTSVKTMLEEDHNQKFGEYEILDIKLIK